VNELIALYRRQAEEAMDYFLQVLSFIPEDKVTWSPSPTAKSALQIAAHCAGYSGMFAWVIREGRFPCGVEEWRSRVDASIAAITTIEEAEAVLRRGTAECLAAYDMVKLEQVWTTVESPQGSTPFTFFLGLPAGHLDGHTSQLDYLQTCWDDQVVHV
jgi:hypothetical protein